MAANIVESLKLLANERICLSRYMSYVEVWLPEKLGRVFSHVSALQFRSQRRKDITEERSACLALYLCRLLL